MAGKIVADTLEHSTAGSVTTDYVVNGSAKAWISLSQGSTHTTNDSHNVASISDDAAGTTTMSLTNSMSSGTYSITSSNSEATLHAQVVEANTTSSAYRTRFLDGSGTLTDDDFNSSTVHGDLA